MGWEEHLFALFDDLEQQAEALFDAERDLELADRSRAEYHHVSLASRLMASLDREVVLHLVGGGTVAGTLARVGTGWCLVRGAQDWVVRTAAVLVVGGASERSVPEVAWPAVTRLGLGSALRRVGADFVEAGLGEDAGRGVLVAFTALAAVQSRD